MGKGKRNNISQETVTNGKKERNGVH